MLPAESRMTDTVLSWRQNQDPQHPEAVVSVLNCAHSADTLLEMDTCAAQGAFKVNAPMEAARQLCQQ